MALRRRRARVVGFTASGEGMFVPSSGTLPRGTYRDLEAGPWYGPPRGAVYQDGDQPRRLLPEMPTFIYPAGQRRVWSRSDLQAKILPSWRAVLAEAPYRVRFCVQRKSRREVLFAFRRAGYSGSARKSRWRRTSNSNYGC